MSTDVTVTNLTAERKAAVSLFATMRSVTVMNHGSGTPVGDLSYKHLYTLHPATASIEASENLVHELPRSRRLHMSRTHNLIIIQLTRMPVGCRRRRFVQPDARKCAAKDCKCDTSGHVV